MEPTDTQGTSSSGARDAQDTASNAAPGTVETHTDTEVDLAGDGGATTGLDAEGTETGDKNTPAPFSNGKEKFTVNGKDFEWDWATTKKYAQLGRSGQIAQQKAAETERKSREFYGRLTEGAKNDPEGVIRLLLGQPSWKFGAKPTRTGGAATADGRSTEGGATEDPRDQEIQELKGQVQKLLQGDEERQLEQERNAFTQELEDAVKSYPILDSKYYREYVKSEYRKSLMKGAEVSVDDVAFSVAEEIKELQANKDQERNQRLKNNRERATVTGRTGGDTGGEKAMSRDDVRRLAGRLT